ncbi:MAG: hypothetical protein DRI75_05940 [Bacteroidetes bacterium]|nr:MAG: hypothetical protein DRI75_05940 [Bacteroidota bacterium]
MRNHNYLNMQVLKVFILLGIVCLNNSIIYGQDSMEDAIVSLSFLEENESKIIVTKAVDQSGLPIEDLELYYYVKRTFSLLPIGDPFNATDENGIIEVEFPNDLPGDTEGNVIIVVKIIESDLYNDLTLETTKNWGLLVQLPDQKVEKRSLWAAAANAPISLILTVSVMIISVWYIICYILFKLYKISKIKPLKP